MLRILLVGLVLAITTAAHADSDTLAPLTYASLIANFKKALIKASIRDGLTLTNCLNGSEEKRKVCTYKLGSFMQVMAITAKGGSDIVELTLICTPSSELDAPKCVLAYSAAIEMTAPSINLGDRQKILGLLIQGIGVVNEITLTTDERKFILQKAIGLWFHVEALDAAE